MIGTQTTLYTLSFACRPSPAEPRRDFRVSSQSLSNYAEILELTHRLETDSADDGLLMQLQLSQ